MVRYRHLSFAILFGLGACSTSNDPLSNHSTIGADPLAIGTVPQASADDSAKKAYLDQLVADSMSKCYAFENRLTLLKDSSDVTGDILSTTLSALATAITPVGTSHALSAASTIVSGSKTAIDTDVFAKATVNNIDLTLENTYWTQIAQYNDAIKSASSIDISYELNRVNALHYSCSLNAAEQSIGNTIGSPPAGENKGAPNAGGNPPAAGFRAPGRAGQQPGSAQTYIPGSAVR